MLSLYQSGDSEAFQRVCRDHGWKRTVQRRAVFNYLCGNREHPSVETVWRDVRESMPDLSLDSVYRILDDFFGVGLIRRLEGAKILRYDADTSEHDHFICVECGRMFDFTFLERNRVAEMCGGIGEARTMDLVVRGVCVFCRGGE